MNSTQKPVAVVIGATSKWQADGRNTQLVHGKELDDSDLPVGVRVHVNFEPTFLTSTALFASEGRNWELYLMFNQSLREVHLVLVEGNRSVYLIDRGFQEQSRSLREGTVRRTGGAIIAVDSQSGAASSDRARDFYNVFLSWWEVVKLDARAP